MENKYRGNFTGLAQKYRQLTKASKKIGKKWRNQIFKETLFLVTESVLTLRWINKKKKKTTWYLIVISL